LNGIKVTESVFERAFEGILSISKNNKIDLIVNLVFGIEEVLIGSNTEKIVRLSNVPVLVIKKEHPKFTTANFVFASDFQKK
jgi:nucleotide-binding universal stress UspA family protein